MTFYERLAILMSERNATPYKISKVTGIGQATFTRWKGTSILPDGANLVKLADYFNVSVDYLLGRDDVPNRKEGF